MDPNLPNLSLLRVTPSEENESEEEIELDKNEEIEFDQDEEEEEEEAFDVQLGFVEKPKNPRLLLRHLFPSKAGGVPAWLDPVNLPPLKSRICGFCNEPLQFLLQIYAPIEKHESAFHRTLFVFICPSMSCLLRDQHEQWRHKEGNPSRSVKIFRSQLPKINPYYSSVAPKFDGTDRPLNSGAPLCSWCGTWQGDKICSSCRRARYCSEKHQAMHWKSGHKTECHTLIGSSPNSNESMRYEQPIKVYNRNLWPEYEIAIHEEYDYNLDKSEGNNISALIPVNKSNGTDSSMQSIMDQFEADTDKKNWAEFQERIARAPAQVIRYCREANAKPLWPLMVGRPSRADIPSCRYCKGTLCYEFQVMPQLLYYLGVKNETDSLDYATIIVYTCTASCESNVSYREEFAWVQLYPTA